MKKERKIGEDKVYYSLAIAMLGAILLIIFILVFKKVIGISTWRSIKDVFDIFKGTFV